MIIVDNALAMRERDRNPVRVAMVGAGYMGRGIAFRMLAGMPGMRLVAIANRTPYEAERAYREAGADSVRPVATGGELDDAIDSGE